MNRQPANSEDTITTLFVEILMPMSATWSIYEQSQHLSGCPHRRHAHPRRVSRYRNERKIKEHWACDFCMP